MSGITLTRVSKSYVSGLLAVKNLDLDIPEGSFTCLLGPSGCGKTTTLRMIAGLEHPTDGEITVDDRVLDSVPRGIYVPPERRSMGLVFQSYALWPHLTVAKNVEFGLRVKKAPAAERRARVGEALKLMQIDHLADRYPAQLSGGQQQRVSLARMLAVDPTVLLLDEPLSNLDARLRLEMRAELKRLHDATGHTFVLVTHDQIEAMTMATHVAVMHDGVLEQMAAPMEVYDRPATRFVAEFVGSPPMNFVDPGGSGPAAESLRRHLVAAGFDPATAAHVGVRPEALHLATFAGAADGGVPDGAWSFPATVATVLPTGSSTTVSLTAGVDTIFLTAFAEVGVPTGGTVTCYARDSDLHLFDDQDRRLSSWDNRPARILQEVR
jgi:iron(III) transport system ATP-binding protein